MIKGNVVYRCDGCFEETEAKFVGGKVFEYGDPFTTHSGELFVKRRMLSQKIDLAELVPGSWVWPDPYTGCCYCPKCWAGIVEDIGDAVEAGEIG